MFSVAGVMFLFPKINSLPLTEIYECTLRLTYDNYPIFFKGILMIFNEKTIHQQNFTLLAKETYKFMYMLSSLIMCDLRISRVYICQIRKL